MKPATENGETAKSKSEGNGEKANGKTENGETEKTKTEQEQRALFNKIAAARRRVAFKNPLLDFDGIVFIKHNKSMRGHMVDQYLGFNSEKSGGCTCWSGRSARSRR